MQSDSEFLTSRDKKVFKEAGYGKPLVLGEHPAVLIIDVTYEFTGETREPILKAIKKVRTACGEEAWEAVEHIGILLQKARALCIPVIYTIVDRGSQGGGPYAGKNQRSQENAAYTAKLFEIVAEISPRAGDLVIAKVSPSAFNGTNLLYNLNVRDIDTLIVTGGTTSGCVRASVVDAFAYGYKVAVVKEGVFDRGQASHAVNLFEMNAKYANVMELTEVITYLEKNFNCLNLNIPKSR